MPERSAVERLHLQTLAPHARQHAEQLLREYPTLRITSGRRTVKRNRQVGGSPRSFHLRGRAADFVGDRWSLVRAAGAAWALRVGHGCTGPEEVLLEDLDKPNQHLHVAW